MNLFKKYKKCKKLQFLGSRREAFWISQETDLRSPDDQKAPGSRMGSRAISAKKPSYLPLKEIAAIPFTKSPIIFLESCGYHTSSALVGREPS